MVHQALFLCLRFTLYKYFFIMWFPGKCTVDYTEKGWFVQYIDRDPETIRKQEAMRAKEKMDMDDEERTSQFIQKQIERAAETAKQVSSEYTELQRARDDEKGDADDKLTLGKSNYCLNGCLHDRKAMGERGGGGGCWHETFIESLEC